VKRTVMVVLLATATVTLAGTASAQQDRWIGRVRALAVFPNYSSDAIGSTGTTVKVGDSGGGEASLTRFVKPNWALELSAATMPLKLTTVGGQYPNLDVGQVWLATALLSLEYHFSTLGRFKPYLGVGAAYARPMGYTLTQDMAQEGISNLTFSSSLRVFTQGGTDYEIGKGWRFNVDVRYVPVTSRVDFRLPTGGSLATIALVVDPIVVGFGIGHTF
jgi:outer membrane protein